MGSECTGLMERSFHQSGTFPSAWIEDVLLSPRRNHHVPHRSLLIFAAGFEMHGIPMEFKVDTLEDGGSIIHLNGRLDIAGVQEIESPLSALMKTLNGPVLVDLAGVTFLASVGIRLILSSAKALSSRKLKMALFSPQPMVAETLKTSVIDMYMPICNDLPAAQEALTKK